MPENETEKQQDSPLPKEGQAFGASTETSRGKTRTYTEAEVKKQINDMLAAAGRDSKSIELKRKEAEKKLADAEKRVIEVERLEKEREQRELESVRDDPTALSEFQRRAEIRRREKEVARLQAEAEALRAEANEGLSLVTQWRKEQAAGAIAAKYQVDASQLIEFTDGTIEKMEKLALALSGKSASVGSTTPLPKPDSGITKGSSGTLTIEQVKKMTPEEKMARVKDLAKLPLTI